MENKNIIIILLVIIVILLVAVFGMMMLQSNAKSTTIEIKQTNRTVDDNLFSVNVLDSKGNALSDVMINLSIEDANGKVIIDEEVPLDPEGLSVFDFDLEKGKYVVKASFDGDEKHSGSSTTYNLDVEKVTPTLSEEELIEMEYPEYSSEFGHYRTIETQQELALIETSNGNQYVFGGDGAYTFAGYDSQGYIQLGDYVGKY